MVPNWRFKVVEVPITVTLDAYTAGDVVGGILTSDAIPQLSGGGELSWVRLVDDADQSEPYLLYVFNSTPSTIANDAAFEPTEADWLKCLGVIDIPAANYDQAGSEGCAFAAAKDRKTLEGIAFDNLADGHLYFYLVANASTPDYAAADDVTIHIGLWVA